MATQTNYKKRIIGDKIVFYKITDKKNMKGPAVFIQYDNYNKTYSVYRCSIYYLQYNKVWELGNGWNLYQNLNKETAIRAAKNALKYL